MRMGKRYEAIPLCRKGLINQGAILGAEASGIFYFWGQRKAPIAVVPTAAR